MFNFFVSEENRQGDTFQLTGADCNHIKNVLRMKKGDTILVSCQGKSHLCTLTECENGFASAQIIEEDFQDTELPVKLYLFQGLPKGDKMELIIQKAVELGVHKIIPVEMNRCVVKLDGKKKVSKTARWQAIAESAAKQSKRTLIPHVETPLSYGEAMKRAEELDLFLVPYENKRGMEATEEALDLIKQGFSVGILIGPEGGFEETEIEKALVLGGRVISLGQRILRTETAAITALGMCMLYTEMKLKDESND
ncbi:MAG: 16S rRNA (uracil(1498)-N(3))-methyltransferase [Ruminococcaceae bacterium]|nr:16S rRNA (uracil(1498)-N(3))-methyltransferase [Oscillospiraceae bacterium]